MSRYNNAYKKMPADNAAPSAAPAPAGPLAAILGDVNSGFLFVAKTKSGKSHFMRHLLHYLVRNGKFQWGLVICPTKFDGDWTCVPDKYVVADYDEGLIRNMLKIQEEALAKGKVTQAFLILDDCIGRVDWGSNFWANFMSTCRHFHITPFISTQHYYKIPPDIRTQMGFIFVFKIANKKNAVGLHDDFLSLYMGLKQFQEFLARYTNNYGVVMINNSSGSTNVDDILAPMRAPAEKAQFKLEY